MKNEADLNAVIIILIIGGVGYWAYNKYLKTKVDTAKSLTSFFGINF
jgi:hypothetical protein